jgi:hypothetical protein
MTTSRRSPAFEATSKRRKGYPSETRVKRGNRTVHGNKELLPREVGPQWSLPLRIRAPVQEVLPEVGAV